MYEEQRQERLNDGFEQDHVAMLDKPRSKFSDNKVDSLTGMPL